MKYSTVDWTKWATKPTQATFNDWVAARKLKKATTSQAAINLTAPHINKLYDHGVSAEQAIQIAACEGWRGVKFSWVMKWINDNAVSLGTAVFEGNVTSIDNRNTRDLSLEEQLTYRGWAD